MNKYVIIIVVTVVLMVIGTAVRYFTRTGVFSGRKNKDSKNNPDR